ncbi:alpha/beta fold hydrolase [Acidocella sp.]|uniref:alpha/beta fold hydrolase n=1 Tax=Acidocella sp. TaxID=50710 RepID=UPI003D0055A7
MIHAVSLDLSFWEKQIQDLAEGRDVIAVDLPGHGQSASLPQDWSISGVFAGLVAVLDEAEVNSAHLVGLSFGGMSCMSPMAISHPDRVRSLTIFGDCRDLSR